ncbi:MAG: serine hydrolase domain-containing protein, partial [Burkholderiaceae bacterium]
MHQSGQPGCALAIAWDGEPVLEAAFGQADIETGEPLTPRHRFRVASHSKTFTAVALLRLRELGRLRLDDPLGRHLDGLEPRVAAVTIAQVLSHTAGLVRDGADSRQWTGLRGFKQGAEIRDELAGGPSIEPGTRMKYSNHGFALLGEIVATVTGEAYADWVAREVIAAAGLSETLPDGPVPAGMPLARGHGGLLPLGRRVSIPSGAATHAVAPAGGFVSTAADLARFFGGLDPAAPQGLLSVASRRELTRPGWPVPRFAAGWSYGAGVIGGRFGAGVIGGRFGADGWRWIGHSGVFPGTQTRSACVLGEHLAISVLTNAADGLSTPWLEGIARVLQACAAGGAPDPRAAGWRGRWWSPWVAVDLLPVGGQALVLQPSQ